MKIAFYNSNWWMRLKVSGLGETFFCFSEQSGWRCYCGGAILNSFYLSARLPKLNLNELKFAAPAKAEMLKKQHETLSSLELIETPEDAVEALAASFSYVGAFVMTDHMARDTCRVLEFIGSAGVVDVPCGSTSPMEARTVMHPTHVNRNTMHDMCLVTITMHHKENKA